MWRHLSIAVVAHETVVQRVRSNRWRFNFEMALTGGQINCLWKTAMIIATTKTPILIIWLVPRGLLLTYPISPPPTFELGRKTQFKNSNRSRYSGFIFTSWNVDSADLSKVNTLCLPASIISKKGQMHRVYQSLLSKEGKDNLKTEVHSYVLTPFLLHFGESKSWLRAHGSQR